jgi:hypothetical protein
MKRFPTSWDLGEGEEEEEEEEEEVPEVGDLQLERDRGWRILQ